ncbi:MAG: hypothetical protein ACFFAU_12155 [Candidatus Hodarchaeota archaeon]
MLLKTRDPRYELALIRILESDNPDQLKSIIYMILDELIDLIGKYKAKRKLWELKLKGNDDPRKAEFYAIISRLTMLDMVITDLEYFKQVLVEISRGEEMEPYNLSSKKISA